MINTRGYTLVETLVVIGLFTVISFFSVQFFLGTLTGRAKAAAHIEIQEQARAAAHWITYELRRSRGFELTSDFGVNLASVTGSTLDLDTAVVGHDPTTFDIAAGILRLTYGAVSPMDITSDDVQVTNLVFTDLSSSNGKSLQAQFTITIEKQDPTGNPTPLSYTLTSTVELRDR